MPCQSCNVFHRHRETVALRKLFLRHAFLERLLRDEWDDPFETTFLSLGNVLSRVDFSALQKSAQELLKASVDDAKGPPIGASPNT